MDNTVAIALATLSAGIVTKLITAHEKSQQMAREDRNWQRNNLERNINAKTITAAVATEAKRVEDATKAQTGQLIEKIQEHTVLNNQIFNAQNDVNTKFLKLHQRISQNEETLAGIRASLAKCPACSVVRE